MPASILSMRLWVVLPAALATGMLP